MTDLIKNTKGNSLKEEWTAYICREILRVSGKKKNVNGEEVERSLMMFSFWMNEEK